MLDTVHSLIVRTTLEVERLSSSEVLIVVTSSERAPKRLLQPPNFSLQGFESLQKNYEGGLF
jgi:hypothetical protein